MSPEFGSTIAVFPIDEETVKYLELTGRSADQLALVEAYAKEQGLFHFPGAPEAVYTETLALDLGQVEPSMAGPRRPQDRLSLGRVKSNFAESLSGLKGTPKAAPATDAGGGWENEGGDGGVAAMAPPITMKGESFQLHDGSVVIAAITSCTNTSNPSVMVAAGLVAKDRKSVV